MTTLTDLENLLPTLGGSPEAQGLRVFIEKAKALPDNSTMLSKIQRSMTDFMLPEDLTNIRSVEDVRRSLGSGFRVIAE
jgi:hypothetical protein